MDVILGFYALFAVTTALAAVYELYYPVLMSILENEPDSHISENLKLTLFVLFIMTIIFAPFVFPSCVIPHWGDKFRASIFTALLDIKKS